VTAAVAARDLDALRARLAAAPDAERLHPLGLRRVLLGPAALDELAPAVTGLAGTGARVAVLADTTVIRRGDTELKPDVLARLAGSVAPELVTVGDADGRPHADEATVERATSDCAGAAAVVSVGSGTVADIGKAVSAGLGGIPHVVVQTAASVNGFADDQSVLLRHGVKRTVATRWPDVLLIDTQVLAHAPRALNRAGLGDLLATFTAPADWRLAQLVGQDDSYSATTVALTREHGARLLGLGDGVQAADPAALEELAGLLTLSGLSMGVAGRTAPGSGMEHTVSHLVEMRQAGGDGPEALHGAKVGVISILAAVLWRRVRAALAGGALRGARFPTAGEMEPRVRKAFLPLDDSGATAHECWQGYAAKLARWNAEPERIAALAGAWDDHDADLAALVADPADLAHALRSAGAPLTFGDLGIDEDTARWALANCHLMRDRYTVADLAHLVGCWGPGDVDAVLAEAAAVGGGL
jgi:glycerol-1-phosphate dehydrogenase [NAD(P)+]